MGNWNISIRGIGQHHNKLPADAEVMAAKFVEELKAAGHTITGAEMTHGGAVVFSSMKVDAYGQPHTCTESACPHKYFEKSES